MLVRGTSPSATPDFFNGVRHAITIVEAFARQCPGVTYDVTIKVEHLRRHDDRLEVLRDTGCLFVVSAVESIDDTVLARFDKGHTRADFEQVVARCRQVGLTLAPTFIPFTPWTTLAGYHELLRTLDTLDLVEQVAPIQLALRLLIPRGSRLLELDRERLAVELDPFDDSRLVYPWRHLDPRVDRLQGIVAGVVGRRLTASRSAVFDELLSLAAEQVGAPVSPRPVGARDRATVAYLNEPWYC